MHSVMASFYLKGARAGRYGKGYKLQVAVEEDMALIRGFAVVGAVTTLAEKTGVGAISRCATVAEHAHSAGAYAQSRDGPRD